MNNEEEIKTIAIKIKDLYKDDKSNKYILHLIHAFLPIDKKPKIVKSFLETNNSVVKCGITKNNLTDHDRYHNLSTLDLDDEMKGVQLAYSGVNTNNFLSKNAIIALDMFTQSMVKSGDKRITFVMKQIKESN